jgi:uncharacterized protein YndB with AHSA1/START domain
MQIDTKKQIGAVNREVRTLDYEGKPARSVVMAQTYQTSPQDLWNAMTTAERIPRWLLPITGDLKLGGRYQLEGNAGGTIQVCDAPRFLKVTWEYGGQISWVEARIEPVASGSARLTVEHIAHPDERWGQFGPGAVGVGWDLMLAGLDRHLGTGTSVNPEAAMTWMMSDDGKAFMRQSSDAWCAAAIAGGDDPNEAKAAATQTIAAYTGA